MPRHMPVETAKTAPNALTTRTGNDRNEGMLKPERIVLISGIPEPAAMYITFPAGTVAGPGLLFGMSEPLGLVDADDCSLVETEGSELFVNMVALELITPKTSAIPT